MEKDFKALVRDFDGEMANAALVQQTYGFPVHVSDKVPPGEVWLVAPLTEDGEPFMRMRNLRIEGTELVFEAELKRPPKVVILGKIVGINAEEEEKK